jgi:hypothetical protein
MMLSGRLLAKLSKTTVTDYKIAVPCVQNLGMMLSGRLLAGFAAGGYAPSIQIFVAEITEVKKNIIEFLEVIIYNSLFVIKAGIQFVFPCNTRFSHFNSLCFP